MNELPKANLQEEPASLRQLFRMLRTARREYQEGALPRHYLESLVCFGCGAMSGWFLLGTENDPPHLRDYRATDDDMKREIKRIKDAIVLAKCMAEHEAKQQENAGEDVSTTAHGTVEPISRFYKL